MDTLAITKRIETRLTEIGMSKADFYRLSGISSASYSQWKTGKYNPSDKKLKSAAECLGISYAFLRYGTMDCDDLKISNRRPATDDEIKFALFGGDGEITDAMYNEVKQFAAMVKLREDQKKKD